MDKKDTFANKAGQFIANVLIACIAASLSACAIALAVRFITWLF